MAIDDVHSGGSRRPRFWILTEAGQSRVLLWGIDTVERLKRSLRSAGVADGEIAVGPAGSIPQTGPWVVFRADHVFDERLVRGMVGSAGTVLVRPGGAPAAAHVDAALLPETLRFLEGAQPAPPTELRVVSPAEVAAAYTPDLRSTAAPLLLLARADDVTAIEDRLFGASYKGITDLVTKWLWPAPARWLTRILARRHVHPNVVTVISWILVLLVIGLFARGWWGTGLAAAWLMTFLDTVDGKLARVTLTSSRLGGALDHGLDLVHPPFWYVAWAYGLTGSLVWGPVLVIIVGGYVIGRLIEGLFLLFFKLEIHCWRRLDSHFRLITARRNPNMLLLTLGAVVGAPRLGLELVAAWTAVSLAFHVVRLGQAIVRRARGLRIVPWLETVPPRPAGPPLAGVIEGAA